MKVRLPDRRRRCRRLFSTLWFVASALIVSAPPLHATDQVVTDAGDSGGANQLRAKLSALQGSGGGALTFNLGSATIVLVNGVLPAITTTVVIDGGGIVTVSGNNASLVFQINASGTLTLNNITISNGFNASGDGGAIQNLGTLNVNNSKFFQNKTAPAWSGGVILNLGALNITNSEFGSNQAGNGGALYPRFAASATTIIGCNFHDNTTLNTTNGWGGAMLIWDGAKVGVQNSQFINNTANSGSFSSSTIDRGGAVYVTFNSSLTVGNSQFASNSAFFGGALYVDPGGSLTLTGSDLHDNSIGVFDGTQGGGAIYNAGNLLVDTDQLHDNHADGAGGAIDNVGPGSLIVRNTVLRRNQADGGGAIENDGNATVQTSTLADNIAMLYGGAIDAADRTDTTKALTVTASTLSGNNAALHGGAIESEMQLTLINVTINGNSGPEAIDHYDRPITLTNATIAQNTGTGLSLHGSAALLLRNTLLASNAGGNCSGAITSNGFNLSDDTTCGLTNTGDHQGPTFNPLLGPLQNNGGLTKTQLPQAGSPAIDAGTGSGAPARDQRGYLRAGAAPDIGAAEFGGTIPVSLANISTRGFVGIGDNVMIGGFVVTGNGNKLVLLRAIGPSLGNPPINLANVLQDPTLSLFNSSQQRIGFNDNWADADNAGSIDPALRPSNALESAILISLAPGAYTAIVSGLNGGTGLGLVEVFDLDPTAGSKLFNISTRGLAETGDNVLDGGFSVKGPDNETVVVRAKGPSLSDFGLTNVLQNPTLSLFNDQGSRIQFNDDWQTDQRDEIIATGLQPSNPAESAMVRTLAPGNYTAIVNGVNGTTGIALVEIYGLN